MVAKITTPSSIKRALNYNEKKVQKGTASCLHAGNFLKPAKGMNTDEKLQRFEHLIALNRRAKTNTLHISLNFHPTEKLTTQTLIRIGTSYMQKIGFGEQPYLVYEHRDAGHPHLHIVTTTIQADGRRIDTYNIGKERSERARVEIEKSFGLFEAGGHKIVRDLPAITQKLVYGKKDTKAAIEEILHCVVLHYCYTSLPELNAVLRQYNVLADDGSQNSRVNKNGGIYYKVLDEKGKPVSVPVKGSAIGPDATLKHLQKRFEENRERRKPLAQKLKTTVAWTLRQAPMDLSHFVTRLKEEKVLTMLRQNEKGYVYGITFIDLRTKSVFNGSDLGKGFSAAAIQQRLCHTNDLQQPAAIGTQKDVPLTKEHTHTKEPVIKNESSATDLATKILYGLVKPEYAAPGPPIGLIKKKKKRRRF